MANYKLSRSHDYTVIRKERWPLMPACCHFPKISSLVKEMLGLFNIHHMFFLCVCGILSVVRNHFLHGHQWNSPVPVRKLHISDHQGLLKKVWPMLQIISRENRWSWSLSITAAPEKTTTMFTKKRKKEKTGSQATFYTEGFTVSCSTKADFC